MVSPDSPPANTLISDIESTREAALAAIADANDPETLRTLSGEVLQVLSSKALQALSSKMVQDVLKADDIYSSRDLAKAFDSDAFRDLAKAFNNEAIRDAAKVFSNEAFRNVFMAFNNEAIRDAAKAFNNEAIRDAAKAFNNEAFRDAAKAFNNEAIRDAAKAFNNEAFRDFAKAFNNEAFRGAVRALNDDPVRTLSSELMGKKSRFAQLKSRLGSTRDADIRKDAGQRINDAIAAIEEALISLRRGLSHQDRAAQVAGEYIDLTEFVTPDRRGHSHIVTQATQRLEDVFIGLGFHIAEGPEVETDFYNFEALNTPKSHPARSESDTMYLDSGEPGSVLLRTHTSPVQIRVMQTWDLPIYAVMPGRVFRRDTPDATHMPVFHQIEGLVIDRNITFAHLAGTIEAFTKAFFGIDFTSRLRPSYFPFTEPSAEFDIRRANGNWIELGGCGMVHPNVLRAGGIDPDEFTGFAFGFGIDRMAKERHNVDDIREMYTNDLRFLRQF